MPQSEEYRKAAPTQPSIMKISLEFTTSVGRSTLPPDFWSFGVAGPRIDLIIGVNLR